MKTKAFLIIALLCAVAQGVWAQTEVSSESALTTAISGGTTISVKLTENIALSNYVDIPSSKTVTIDLNGKTLNRGLSELTSYGIVIRVENGGMLTVKDSGTGGTITGGYDATGGGICVLGTLNFESGTISGCYGTKGGAIYTTSDGIVNMTGGTITGNTATDGGGIYNNGKLTISGGTISSNNVTEHGGGAVSNHGTLTVNGGTFTNNSGMGNGGGIWSNQDISMQGKVVIQDNTGNGGSTNNLYLSGSDTKINFTGALEQDSRIGVSVEKYERIISSGYNIYHQLPANAYFFSDVDTDYINMSVIEGEIFPKVVDGSNAAIYVERSWTGGNTDGHVVSTPKVATGVNGFHIETDQTLSDGWYQFVGSHEYDDRIVINGDVKFILYDDCNIEFKKGIHINKNRTLTIYAQTAGTGTLRATGDDGSSNNGDAAIGGNNEVVGGNLVIHGGTITAKPSHNCAAGIGGGDGESGMQSVIIWDGDITAEGTEAGAGIGGGNANRGPSVTIYGGTVTAKGGSQAAGIGGGENRGNSTVKIYGGNVTANGNYGGAGIGGGYGGDVDNPIYIYGGTINATGGSGGAGIGGGKGSGGSGGNQNGDIYIYGGKITATGKEDGSGIGGGYDGNGGTIVINGGEVYAYGSTNAYAAAGIGGGGNGNGGNVTINGGYVEAKGSADPSGNSAAGIGGGKGCNGGTVTINGGKVKASSECWSSAIGISRNENKKAVINIASGIKVYSSHQGKTVNKDSRVSACEERGNFEVSVTIESCDHSGATYTIKDANYHTIGNCSYCEMSGSDEAHTFGSYGECGVCGLVSLADDADNSSTIDHWAGETKSVVLTGRKLYKDGNWNTLCLPFAATLSGDLASATVKELDTENEYSGRKTGYDDGTLYLYFKDGPDMLQSGQPYIVKWANTENYVESPVFTNVVFGNGNPTIVTSKDDKVSLVGNFDPVTIGETDDAKHNLYLGAGNTLYYPTASDFKVNAFRAYFHLNGITAGEPTSGSNGIRAFSLHFGDNSEQTGITTTNYTNFTNSDNSWYSLDGRKLSGKPTAKGIYIYNGKKRVIK